MRYGALIIDGAHLEQPLCWLYQHYPAHQPRPLLRHTPYAEIADCGPILLEADEGSPPWNAWSQGESGLGAAVWLEAVIPPEQLFKCLQRRLRIHAPDGREFWLRLGDAGPLRHAWLAGAQWPEGFWHGVSGVWLRHDDTPLRAWNNPTPEADCAPLDSGLVAQVTLDWPLLQALSQASDRHEEHHG